MNDEQNTPSLAADVAALVTRMDELTRDASAMLARVRGMTDAEFTAASPGLLQVTALDAATDASNEALIRLNSELAERTLRLVSEAASSKGL